MRYVIAILMLFLLIGCSEVSENIYDNETKTINETNSNLKINKTTLPIVAIHYSENSEITWDEYLGLNYVEGISSIKLILDSLKIPYVVLNDEEILNGTLTENNSIKYPILISINNHNTSASTHVNDYVSKGGNLFFNGNSFENGGCVDLKINFECDGSLWYTNEMTKTQKHEVLSHIPMKNKVWVSSQQNKIVNANENITYMKAIRDDVEGSMIVIQDYEKGRFFYHSNLRPFVGVREGSPNVMNTFFLKHVIEDSFEKTETPLVQIKPWGEHQSAFVMRFDVEPPREVLYAYFPKFVDYLYNKNIKAVFYILVDQVQSGSEYNGPVFRAKGDKEMELWQDALEKNMSVAAHSTWHFGPDVDNLGEKYNIENSLDFIENLTGKRTDWVSPNFFAQMPSSVELVESLGIKTTGNQKILFLPHRSFNYETGETTSVLEIPTSEIYDFSLNGPDYYLTALDHHSSASLKDLVDVYYSEGGIINVYSHIKPGNLYLLDELIRHVEQKENIWYTTPDEIYYYWTEREKAQINNIHYDSGELVFNVVVSSPVVIKIGNEEMLIEENRTVVCELK